MQAFEAAAGVIRAMAAEPWWGDQMRIPVSEDAAMYGLTQAAI